ncbi:MAG: type II secretion system F family protein [Candidatus Abawacabacteria bacterium]|nr:type II secretion system F family protein [Candidatus Abawacabacteria bacterium]
MMSKIANKRFHVGHFSRLLIGHEKDTFIEDLSTLLDSGLDILSALAGIATEMRSPAMKTLVMGMHEQISAGVPLWKSLEQADIFPYQFLSLIRTGEESGRLNENLKVVVAQHEKDQMFQAKIRSAMMYPVLIMSLTFIIGISIAWFILPRLTTVFSQLKIELPWTTRALIAIGNFLSVYGFIAVPAFILFCISIFYLVFYYRRTKSIGESILFFLPVIKKLLREMELSRWGYIMGTLLNAGIPALDVFKALTRAAPWLRYQRFYQYVHDEVEQGSSIFNSFKSYKGSERLIPLPLQQLVAAGEHSGALAQNMLKIGQAFEGKVDNTTKNLTVLLEPLMLVIVWLGVIGVALAVIMPIYQLIGGLNA